MKRILLSLALALGIFTLPIPVGATVNSQIDKKIYAGDGYSTVFSFPYNIYLATDLAVYETIVATSNTTQLVLNTNYSITLTAISGVTGAYTATINLAGGSSPAGALAVGTQLTILRSLPLTQLINISDYSATPAATWNQALDRSLIIEQQLQEQINRSLLAPVGSTSGTQFPTSSPGNVIGWNSLGGLVNVIPNTGAYLTTSTDPTMGGSNPSDSLIPTQKSVNTYVNTINVKSYGATGNGTTDDTAAIQAAITAVVNSGNKGEVFVPAGTYKISSTLTLDISKVRLVGANAVLSFLTLSNTANGINIIGTNTNTNFHQVDGGIEGIELIGPTMITGSSSGLYFNSTVSSGSTHVNIKNVTIDNFYYGATFNNQAYCINFDTSDIVENMIGVNILSTGTDTGERIEFIGGGIQNNGTSGITGIDYGTGIGISVGQGTVMLIGTSVTYNDSPIVITGGMLSVVSCHIEGNSANSFITVPSSGSGAPIISISDSKLYESGTLTAQPFINALSVATINITGSWMFINSTYSPIIYMVPSSYYSIAGTYVYSTPGTTLYSLSGVNQFIDSPRVIQNPSGGTGGLTIQNADFNYGTSTGSGILLETTAASGNTTSSIQAFQQGNHAGNTLIVNPSGGSFAVNSASVFQVNQSGGIIDAGNTGITNTATTTCGCKVYTNGLCTTIGVCS